MAVSLDVEYPHCSLCRECIREEDGDQLVVLIGGGDELLPYSVCEIRVFPGASTKACVTHKECLDCFSGHFPGEPTRAVFARLEALARTLTFNWSPSTRDLAEHAKHVAQQSTYEILFKLQRTAEKNSILARMAGLPPEIVEFVVNFACPSRLSRLSTTMQLANVLLDDIPRTALAHRHTEVPLARLLHSTPKSLFGRSYITGFEIPKPPKAPFPLPHSWPQESVILAFDWLGCRNLWIVDTSEDIQPAENLWYKCIDVDWRVDEMLFARYKGFLLQDLSHVGFSSYTCLWNVPRPPHFEPENCYQYPPVERPLSQKGQTIRMRMLPVPANSTGVTVLCQRSSSVAMHFHVANGEGDEQFYSRNKDAYRPVWHHMPLVSGEQIIEVAVRGLFPYSTTPQIPCIAFSTTGQRSCTSGPYVPTFRRDGYEFKPLHNQEQGEVAFFCINEQGLHNDRHLRLGVKSRPLSAQIRPDPPTETQNWWNTDLPTLKPFVSACSGIYWSRVDTSRYSTFSACIDEKEGLERCIGLKFGVEVLGQWRTDLTIEEHNLPSHFTLRNVRWGKYYEVFVDRIFTLSDGPDDRGGVAIRDSMEWWTGSSHNQVGYSTMVTAEGV